jgi:hypothetical protein
MVKSKNPELKYQKVVGALFPEQTLIRIDEACKHLFGRIDRAAFARAGIVKLLNETEKEMRQIPASSAQQESVRHD